MSNKKVKNNLIHENIDSNIDTTSKFWSARKPQQIPLFASYGSLVTNFQQKFIEYSFVELKLLNLYLHAMLKFIFA